MDILEIKISNWAKYNQRKKDYKRCWWFSFSNTFLEDPVIWSLSDSEKIAFIYLLCQASKSGSETVRVNFDQAKISANVLKKTILSVVEKLEKFEVLKIIWPASDQHLTSSRPASGGDLTTTEQNRTEEYRRGEDRTRPDPGQDLPELARLWNAKCRSLPKVKTCSPSRLKKIQARLKEVPDDLPYLYWSEIIERIAASNFCCGHNDRGWVATFDWLIQPETHEKVSEGKYDNRKGTGGLQVALNEDLIRQTLEEAESEK